eukprot:365359-Chlamydomonas_euryale.AAC.4
MLCRPHTCPTGTFLASVAAASGSHAIAACMGPSQYATAAERGASSGAHATSPRYSPAVMHACTPPMDRPDTPAPHQKGLFVA